MLALAGIDLYTEMLCFDNWNVVQGVTRDEDQSKVESYIPFLVKDVAFNQNILHCFLYKTIYINLRTPRCIIC